MVWLSPWLTMAAWLIWLKRNWPDTLAALVVGHGAKAKQRDVPSFSETTDGR